MLIKLNQSQKDEYKFSYSCVKLRLYICVQNYVCTHDIRAEQSGGKGGWWQGKGEFWGLCTTYLTCPCGHRRWLYMMQYSKRKSLRWGNQPLSYHMAKTYRRITLLLSWDYTVTGSHGLNHRKHYDRTHSHKGRLCGSANKNAQTMKTGARTKYRLFWYEFWNRAELAESKFWHLLQETYGESGCFVTKSDDPSPTLKWSWWKERPDPCKLSSDLHGPTAAGFAPHCNSVNAKREDKVLKAKNWTVNV